MSHLASEHCAIILVNYKNATDTLACLGALARLAKQPSIIVVVDNNSPDDSVPYIMEGWSALASPVLLRQREAIFTLPDGTRHIFLALPSNTGFAGGNNAALRLLLTQTNCTAFWLLNNDTEPEPNALDALCARLNERPDAGLCGSTLMYNHAPDTIQAAGGCTLSLWTGGTTFLCGGMVHTTLEEFTSERVRHTEGAMRFVVGASCLVRRTLLERVGLLPEDYFLYYEDAAFSLNVVRAGFGLVWAPNSIVRHKEGGSTQASGGDADRAPVRPKYVDYLTVRNRVALVRRYRPLALPVLFASLAGVYINRIRRGQADRLGLILRAAWHGLIGRMGMADSMRGK